MRIVTARNAARRNSICAHRTGIITASKAMGVRVRKRERGIRDSKSAWRIRSTRGRKDQDGIKKREEKKG